MRFNGLTDTLWTQTIHSFHPFVPLIYLWLLFFKQILNLVGNWVLNRLIQFKLIHYFSLLALIDGRSSLLRTVHCALRFIIFIINFDSIQDSLIVESSFFLAICWEFSCFSLSLDLCRVYSEEHLFANLLVLSVDVGKIFHWFWLFGFKLEKQICFFRYRFILNFNKSFVIIWFSFKIPVNRDRTFWSVGLRWVFL